MLQIIKTTQMDIGIVLGYLRTRMKLFYKTCKEAEKKNMERRHAIIIIKNKKNEYLQYYEKRWNSYLFLNCKIESQYDIEKIENEVRQKLDVNKMIISYVMDKVHTKFSESDKINKEYHHYFFTVNIENMRNKISSKEFVIADINFKWYSYEELLEDARIQKVNGDIINFIKEIQE